MKTPQQGELVVCNVGGEERPWVYEICTHNRVGKTWLTLHVMEPRTEAGSIRLAPVSELTWDDELGYWNWRQT